MGYTHYYNQNGNIAPKTWKQIVEGVNKITNHCKNMGIDLECKVDSKTIQINGVGAEAHEDLYISRIPKFYSWENTKEPLFRFCKTARKKYDLAVCLCLLHVETLINNDDKFKMSSDGDWNVEWQQSREIYEELFKCTPRVF